MERDRCFFAEFLIINELDNVNTREMLVFVELPRNHVTEYTDILSLPKVYYEVVVA